MPHSQSILTVQSWPLGDYAASSGRSGTLHVAAAATCLLVALWLMKGTAEPIGVLLKAIAAASLAMILVATALVLLAVALLGY
jgi:hypothetical protein